jgi:hypothetical protein
MEIFTRPDSLRMGLLLNSGRGRNPMCGGPARSLLVSGIRWDSGFRGSGLLVGDRLLAIDGHRLSIAEFDEWINRARLESEGEHWKGAGRNENDTVTLTVARRVRPGTGWTELDVTGRLRPDIIWTNEHRHWCFGAEGPSQRDYDDFSTAWLQWHEDVTKAWNNILDDGWLLPSFTSDVHLTQLLEHEQRMQFLEQKYPGPYARAMRDDFDKVAELLRGRPYTLEPDALAFRHRAEQGKRQIAEAGHQARAAFLEAHAAELLNALPSLDPILDDRSAVVGKLVEMPTIGNRDWINQGPTTYFVFNDGNSWFFTDAESPSAQRILLARSRYSRDVDPDVRAEFRFIARIEDTPSLIVVNEQGRFGLRVDPVAATIGDNAFFVEVPSTHDDEQPARYAGEETLGFNRPQPPLDDAPPEQVLRTFFTALKEGDLALWTSLHATFSVYFRDDGSAVIGTGLVYSPGLTWEDGRRKILESVCDVAIVWIDDMQTLATGDEFEGAPRVEQIFIEVDHVRCLEDGSFRTFSQLGLCPIWTLQRIDDGPWRITTDNWGI